ncbi:hypothetical protein Q75_15670 [Bacillus coahuilensis p1.1.43]|uniref:Sortase n=2 Tax=Bacillus coahuilensis TaxID=408580 RepID=A0A147K4R7_9BACI|nr:hypothetical protein Q75_15670 [Bacillus coahuilensis p1.1.43]
MKYAGILLLLSGVGLISYASFHLFIQQEEQNMALNEAKAQVFSAEKEVLGASTSTYSFEKGDIIGVLVIPKLNRELPIIEGTDEEELEKGVGHYSSTKLPNQKDRIFLAGHRDTTLREMGKLEEGDYLLIEMTTGTYTYEIFEMFVVHETDMSAVQSTKPNEILTLSTCFPFDYIGSAEERYIINAKRIY